jgi:hypothetical protein
MIFMGFKKQADMSDRIIECYFYMDGDHEQEDGFVRPMCVKCHEEKFGYLGWHYKGPVGPWKYVCGKCDETILDGIEDDGQFEMIEQ